MARRRMSKFREKVRANAQDTGGVSALFNLPEDAEFFKEKKGKFLIDIIPYEVTRPGHPDEVEPGDIWYKRPFFVHFGIGTAEKAYICPRSVGQKCPICEYRERLMKEDFDEHKDVIDALKPRVRVLYNVRVLNSSKYEEDKVYLWQIAFANFQKQLNTEIREGEEEWADFPDPEVGYTLKVRFVEESFQGRKFLQADRIDFIERDEPIPDEILEQAYPLDDILKVLPYEKLEEIFWESADTLPEPSDHIEEEEEEEERPKRKALGARKAKQVEEETEEERPRRKAKKVEKEPEEEEEKPRHKARKAEEEEDIPVEKPKRKAKKEEAEEEEEVEEKPKRKAHKKREEEEIEEEEEKPKKKSKRKREEEEEEAPEEECPYGHEFGVDFDETDDCDVCELWPECRKAHKARG